MAIGAGGSAQPRGVTAALRAISGSVGSEVVFKGGTSLSKAYGLIHRFSEDIDLLVIPTSDDAPYVEELFDRLHDAAEAAIPGSRREVAESTPGLSREMRVIPNYETSRQRGVGNAVRLEAGVRGGPNPVERRSIRPMLVDAIAGVTGDEFASFELNVLHPARTLVEKLFAVIALAERVRSDKA